MLIIKASKLDHHAGDWHKVVVVNDVEVIDDCVPKVHQNIAQCLSIVPVARLGIIEPFEDLFEGVLIFSNDKSHVSGCVLNLLGEILREHIVNLDDESECDKTLNDHGELLGLTNGDLKNDFGKDGRNDLHGANKNVDKPSPLATLGRLDILQIP